MTILTTSQIFCTAADRNQTGKNQFIPHREHILVILIPYGVKIEVNCKSHKTSINTLCRPNAELLPLNLAVHILTMVTDYIQVYISATLNLKLFENSVEVEQQHRGALQSRTCSYPVHLNTEMEPISEMLWLSDQNLSRLTVPDADASLLGYRAASIGKI